MLAFRDDRACGLDILAQQPLWIICPERLRWVIWPGMGGQRDSFTSEAARTADSSAPSIQACLSDVCSPAKWIGPSGVGMAGCRRDSRSSAYTSASPHPL